MIRKLMIVIMMDEGGAEEKKAGQKSTDQDVIDRY